MNDRLNSLIRRYGRIKIVPARIQYIYYEPDMDVTTNEARPEHLRLVVSK